MSVKLLMQPGRPPMSWRRFCQISNPYSIAFASYVNEGPRFDPDGPRMNCNPHEGVDRLATRATCAQTLLAIRQGLFKSFTTDEGELRIDAYFNDCDQDVCVTWFLLNQGCLVSNVMSPALNRLVMMEDMLDSTAGAYPFPTHLPLLQKLAWIFEPYTQFRSSGELYKKDPASYTRVVTDVELRIMRYILDGGGTLPLDTRYEVIGSRKHWTIVREIGAHARTAMFADGINSFISARELPGNAMAYVMGLMSPFIRRPVAKIIAALNDAEQCGEDRWGGSNTIWGSPRVSGSKLPLSDIIRIVESASA